MNIVIDNTTIFQEEKVSSPDDRYLFPKLHSRPPTTALLFPKLYRRLPTTAFFSLNSIVVSRQHPSFLKSCRIVSFLS